MVDIKKEYEEYLERAKQLLKNLQEEDNPVYDKRRFSEFGGVLAFVDITTTNFYSESSYETHLKTNEAERNCFYYHPQSMNYNGFEAWNMFGDLTEELIEYHVQNHFLNEIFSWSWIGGRGNAYWGKPNIDMFDFEMLLNGEISQVVFTKIVQNKQQQCRR